MTTRTKTKAAAATPEQPFADPEETWDDERPEPPAPPDRLTELLEQRKQAEVRAYDDALARAARAGAQSVNDPGWGDVFLRHHDLLGLTVKDMDADLQRFRTLFGDHGLVKGGQLDVARSEEQKAREAAFAFLRSDGPYEQQLAELQGKATTLKEAETRAGNRLHKLERAQQRLDLTLEEYPHLARLFDEASDDDQGDTDNGE